jgi:predicted Zn-dependent protease with MMP-like domain
MLDVTDEQFDQIISQAMDELPEKYITGLKNVLITYEDEPTAEQRTKLQLNCHQTLFGLYEGIPLTKRGAGYNMVLPDRITLFKNPLLHTAADIAAFKSQVKHTLWHEIAHYYGLDHDRIHEIERNWR